jgi:hypothetical protein
LSVDRGNGPVPRQHPLPCDGNAPAGGWVTTYLRQMQADLVDLRERVAKVEAFRK